MKTRFLTILLLLAIILTSCDRGTPSPTPTVTLPPTPTATPLPTPSIETTRVPDAKGIARTYLDAWKVENYPAMYAALTQLSRDAINEESFTRRYTDVISEAAADRWDYEILAALVQSPTSAQVNYRVSLHSVLVGDIARETVMNLSLENGQWKIQWDDALILPELKGGNYLRMDYRIPSRANIYDRFGSPLVAQADAVAIGLNTALVTPDEQGSLLSLLQEVTGVRAETLRPKLEDYRDSGWYLPVADISAEQAATYMNRLSAYAGVILSPFRARYYFDGGIAPHVTGYMSAIQPEEVDNFKRLGYQWTERVGRDGLELWGEQYLGGTRGGVLYVIAPDGNPVTELARRDPQPAQSITTTIDKTLQEQAELALAGVPAAGAIVVIERDTGRVLAMASSPTFNPNLFEPTNYNSQSLIGDLYGEGRPLYNRATQGQYPLGSVFKIITMSAGLQSGLYNAESPYQCGYHFEELGSGIVLDDWTWTHFLDDGKTQPSGLLTLPEGLMKSCNPYFWHIGLDLYDRGMVTMVSNMARGFGLGSPTGIEISEEPGNIPDPTDRVDATNLAIGQGNTQVTPLQVAAFVAAVGNGGTLYVPQVVERIAPPDGEPTYVFTPTIRGTLPITGTNLQILQEAMVTVLGSRGTAPTAGRFLNSYNIPAAGKTGTAQTPFEDPHAWFAGYTFANREGRPDIAVAVILENQGEGSEWAAPIFAAIVYQYFYPDAQRPLFWWEAAPGVFKTPTPIVTDTPTPEPTLTETPES